MRDSLYRIMIQISNFGETVGLQSHRKALDNAAAAAADTAAHSLALHQC